MLDTVTSWVVPSETSASARNPTNLFERWLLFIVLLLLPLEETISTIHGRSALWVFFIIVACYVGLARPRGLLKTSLQPTYLAGFVFCLMAVFAETGHPNTDYFIINRIAQMLLGSVLIATLCRDKRALATVMFGFIVAGTYLSLIFILSQYTKLSSVLVSDFEGASSVRMFAYRRGRTIGGDLNNLSAFMAEGSICALAVGFAARRTRYRVLAWAVGGVCFVGASMPLSRGGIVMGVVAITGMFLCQRGRLTTTFTTLFVAGTVCISCIPTVALRRLETTTLAFTGKHSESRMRIYKAVYDNLSEYIMLGVGSGNFWSVWGRRAGFFYRKGITGAHNSFAAVTIYWGIIALFLMLLIIWLARRSIPRFAGRSPLSTAVVGTSLGVLVVLCVSHTVYDKIFGIALAMATACRCWIWPSGEVEESVAPNPTLRIEAAS